MISRGTCRRTTLRWNICREITYNANLAAKVSAALDDMGPWYLAAMGLLSSRILFQNYHTWTPARQLRYTCWDESRRKMPSSQTLVWILYGFDFNTGINNQQLFLELNLSKYGKRPANACKVNFSRPLILTPGMLWLIEAQILLYFPVRNCLMISLPLVVFVFKVRIMHDWAQYMFG